MFANALIAFSVAALIARSQHVTTFPVLFLAVSAPYAFLTAIAALAVALFLRRNILACASSVIALLMGITQFSWYYIGRAGELSTYAELRVMSSNLRHGLAAPVPFVKFAARNVDVLMVSEITFEAVSEFERAGITKEFNHSLLLPAPMAGGIGIWSRFPLKALPVTINPVLTATAAQLSVPSFDMSPIVASIHVHSPMASRTNTVARWRESITEAKNLLRTLSALAGNAAVIVGGDFNSTPDIRQFRDFLAEGYQDANRQTGSGFMPTFPSNSFLPPVLAIDHILTLNAVVAAARSVGIEGTDHRSVLASVRIPVSPVT